MRALSKYWLFTHEQNSFFEYVSPVVISQHPRTGAFLEPILRGL